VQAPESEASAAPAGTRVRLALTATALAAAPRRRLGRSGVGSGVMPPYQRKANPIPLRMAITLNQNMIGSSASGSPGVRYSCARPEGRITTMPMAKATTSA